MSCSNKFTVSPAQFDAGAKSLNITGDIGDIINSGVQASYIFDRVHSALTVTVTKKPFIIPCSAIFSKITEALK